MQEKKLSQAVSKVTAAASKISERVSDGVGPMSRISAEGSAMRSALQGKNQVHYEGPLGSFDYDPTQFQLQDVPVSASDFGSGGTFKVLKYIGTETNGAKIHIPEGLKDGSMMFMETNLESSPKLPSSLQSGFSMFSGCKKLKSAAMLPLGMTETVHMYSGCTNLEQGPSMIPPTVKDAACMFTGCSNMKNTPKLSRGLVSGEYMFAGCKNLTELPVIPKTMVATDHMTHGCDGLRTAETELRKQQYEAAREKYVKKVNSSTIRQKSGSIFSAFMQVHAMRRMGYSMFTAPMMVHMMRKNGTLGRDFAGGMTALAMSHNNSGIIGLMSAKLSGSSKKREEQMRQRRDTLIAKWDQTHSADGTKRKWDATFAKEAHTMAKSGVFSKIADYTYSEKAPIREQYGGSYAAREQILQNLAKVQNGTLPSIAKQQMAEWYQDQLSGYASYYQEAKKEIESGTTYTTKEEQKKALKGLRSVSYMQVNPLMASAKRMQSQYGLFSDEALSRMDKLAESLPQNKNQKTSFANRTVDQQKLNDVHTRRMQQAVRRFSQFETEPETESSMQL